MSDLKTPIFSLEELVELSRQGKLRSGKNEFEKKNQDTQRSSGSFRDVHKYDGGLKYSSSQSFDHNYKLHRFGLLDKILVNQLAKAMLQQIALGRSTFDYSNKDCATGKPIDASDLLADILSRKMSIDVFLLLEEQLADNYLLGQCQSGKIVRLMKIYQMVID